MALEIARRLAQDGVTWETVVADEASGSLPDTAGHDEGDLLALDAGLEPVWTPPAAAGLPTLVLRDSTGGTITVNIHRDPTPVTNYIVVRDDLGAAADPSDYPLLPEGLYLCGGYVDWVPDAGFLSPVGKVATYAEINNGAVDTAYPEGDLGRGLPMLPLADHGNIIEAQSRLMAASGGDARLDMKIDYSSTDPSEVFTWVRWVFWACKVA